MYVDVVSCIVLMYVDVFGRTMLMYVLFHVLFLMMCSFRCMVSMYVDQLF